MKNSKKIKYQGGPSEIMDSIHYYDYEIKCLKHGNTGHVLYKFPSKIHSWEDCWTMDIQTAKNGIEKYKQQMTNMEEDLKIND